jgi:UDP-N-acetylglucosamine 2-epimerase (non-hydrolysing)
MPVVFPVHPRTRKMVEEFGFDLDGIQAINPVGFLEFLQLESNARLALTDSEGVQEETCILGVPCVTLRDNTERPETLEVRSNVLAGADALRMVENARRMMQQGNGWKNPFGDGRAGESILDHLTAG